MPIDPQTGKEVYDHLVALTPGTAEYRMVEKQFSSTMIQQTATKAQRSGQFGQVQLQNLMLVGSNNASFSQLVSIERLQNPNLYGQYIARKKQMDKHNPKGTQNERWLYHGTTSDTCEKINTQGFNRSFKGKNGKMLVLVFVHIMVMVMIQELCMVKEYTLQEIRIIQIDMLDLMHKATRRCTSLVF